MVNSKKEKRQQAKSVVKGAKAVVVDMGAALSDPDNGKQTDQDEKRKTVKLSESKLPAKKGKRELFKTLKTHQSCKLTVEV